jgi:hypothetical protein
MLIFKKIEIFFRELLFVFDFDSVLDCKLLKINYLESI